MTPEKLARISELTKIAKERTLTKEEQEERQALRSEYLSGIRKNLIAQLGEKPSKKKPLN